MTYETSEKLLKNGKTAIFRSPTEADAHEMVEYLCKTAGETDFLIGYPEERKTIYYYKLFHKISSLRYLSYKYFRTTIFDCMNLISKESTNE